MPWDPLPLDLLMQDHSFSAVPRYCLRPSHWLPAGFRRGARCAWIQWWRYVTNEYSQRKRFEPMNVKRKRIGGLQVATMLEGAWPSGAEGCWATRCVQAAS